MAADGGEPEEEEEQEEEEDKPGQTAGQRSPHTIKPTYYQTILLSKVRGAAPPRMHQFVVLFPPFLIQNKQLMLSFRRGSYLVEASDQTLRLLGHASLDTPLDHSLDVLLLVLLGHWDTRPPGLQLSLCDLHNNRQRTYLISLFENSNKNSTKKYSMTYLSKHLFVDGEGEVQHVLDVVVLHPLETLVEFFVQELQVTQVTGTASTGSEVTNTQCTVEMGV